MAQKHYNRRKKIDSPEHRKQRMTRLLWLILLVLVIIFLFEAIKVISHRLMTSHPKVVTLSIPHEPNASTTPTYDFYKVLPKMSMQSLTMKNLKDNANPITVNTPATTANNNNSYTLQIASVRDVDQATQLATKINAVKNLNGNTAQVALVMHKKTPWYTVRLGPFAKRSDAEDIQNTLDRHYFSGMILVNHSALKTGA